MTTVDCGGVFVDVVGEGPTVLVFPGGPARHPDYLGHLAGLDQDGYRLATVFPRGVGPSPIPDDQADYAASRQVAAVEAVRAALGLEAVTLIAHSAGAVVALEYAAAFADRLERLVLITPSTAAVGLTDSDEEFESQLAKQRSEPWFATARQAMDDIDEHGFTPERRAAMLPLLYASWSAEAQAHAASDPLQSSPERRAHYFDEEPDPLRVRAAMADVRCPVRIIIGEADPGPGPELAARLADLFPDASVAIQPGAGHFPWVTDPARFRDLLRSALTR